MASRLRIGAALLGATALLSLSTLAAAADVIVTPVPDDKQTPEDQKYGYSVTIDKKTLPPGAKDQKEYGTLLIPLDLQENGKNSRVFAYCVELPTDLDKNKGLKEVGWKDHPGKYTHFKDNAGKVLWILTNSFPTKTTDDLDDLYKGDYDEEEAIAATQAAIWHFSDGVDITGATSGKKEADADVVKLYNKLIEQAEPIDQPNETPKLEIDPKSKSGKAGEKIGPFKVTTTATKLELTAQLPDGVTITDKDGNPLKTEKSGKDQKATDQDDKISEFFVKVPEDAAKGEAKLNVSAEVTIEKGRLFVAQDDSYKTQSLVIAQNTKIKLDKDAKADWTKVEQPTTPSTPSSTPETTTPTTTTTTTNNPAPGGSTDDNLAYTGASILWPLVGGLALVGAGIGALFIVRRKKAGAAE